VEKAWQCLPEYLNQKGYREPCDASDCAIDIAFGNRQPIFEMLANDPSNLGRFNKFMTVQRRGRVSWLEFFPVEQQLIKGFSHKENVVIMVDVGGGHGHELQEIMNKYPKLPGRVILQDLRVTIDKVDAGPQMETMPHDFFTYQRIKGTLAPKAKRTSIGLKWRQAPGHTTFETSFTTGLIAGARRFWRGRLPQWLGTILRFSSMNGVLVIPARAFSQLSRIST